jgi:hypothetical protein
VASWYEAEVNVRFLLTFALCSWPAFAQTNQDADSNMACVDRLEMPVYPPLANAARITGSVTATVVVASDGSLQTQAVGHKLLAPAVEKAIRASTFLVTCGGKSVRLVFNFVLAENLAPDKLSQRVSFGYPNQFWISVPPPSVINQASR